MIATAEELLAYWRAARFDPISYRSAERLVIIRGNQV
jgi:hypothetical protein